MFLTDQGVAAEVLHRAFRLEPDNVHVLNGFGQVMGTVLPPPKGP